jgi:uncharacterized protein (TIGR00290 family)
MKPKALLSFSSGKDSAYALDVVRRAAEVEVVGLITTVTTAYDRVSMHGVRLSLLRAQADALGLSCTQVSIPPACSNEIYERAFFGALATARGAGVSHVVFGDLYLEDIRAYREQQMKRVALTPVFPLWGRDTKELAGDMLDSGIVATVTCVDPRRLAASFAGRTWDRGFLDALPAGVDACGENGEFHTFVSDGPGFRAPVATRPGAIVERDGFVFADVLPA